jgi:hypothetical protein
MSIKWPGLGPDDFGGSDDPHSGFETGWDCQMREQGLPRYGLEAIREIVYEPPRLCDFPAPVLVAICYALSDRDPAITRAIRGYQCSAPQLSPDQPLTLAEWALAARIHAGDTECMTPRVIGSLPERLIRLGLFTVAQDGAGAFVPAMGKVLALWPLPTLEHVKCYLGPPADPRKPGGDTPHTAHSSRRPLWHERKHTG